MCRLIILAAVALGMLASPASPAGTIRPILMKDIAFAPKQVTVHVGDTLEWANQDIVAHTATAKDKSWEVNVLPGKNGRVVMKAAGTFDYICRYHPNMTGEIIIEP
ncbi:cupredoxin domain-containing protein [Microvirga rosea]|uniref:cupredoxin domain-containing protein n=1 Tax=Microvirga rosea TaxID=2715425 RepID=UPI001D0B3BBE|nr:cupredoxin domain-containing protein [Microvirga rosea]MCB8822912.1 cupredoxin domain-containing protein [Microvirga rosea]